MAVDPDFLCDRCGAVGKHWLEDCKSIDRASVEPTGNDVDPNFVCDRCGAVGDHWLEECPEDDEEECG